ncbi:glycosyltransferase, partial [uncultured Duncaniella sp.]
EILYHLDGTLVPSKCYETFSLVTLESLAHGRPVIVSDHVGAKDIVYEYNPNFIFSSQSELKNILKSILLNPKILIKENEKILSQPWKFSMEKHSQDIFSFYYS